MFRNIPCIGLPLVGVGGIVALSWEFSSYGKKTTEYVLIYLPIEWNNASNKVGSDSWKHMPQ